MHNNLMEAIFCPRLLGRMMRTGQQLAVRKTDALPSVLGTDNYISYAVRGENPVSFPSSSFLPFYKQMKEGKKMFF